jgi:hypothetical protein
MLTPGSPSDWSSLVGVNNIATWNNITIGIGNSNSSTISTQKMLTLMAMSNSNYQATKLPMGIGYDYYITIYSPSGYNVSMGLNPITRNATAIQIATFPVIMDNGATGTMRLEVWTNTTFGVS